LSSVTKNGVAGHLATSVASETRAKKSGDFDADFDAEDDAVVVGA
jgi:ribosomal protein L13